MNGLALFAGGGGLELGLSLALGTDYRTIAYVERECTSAAVLAANMERGWLDKAPVWDDVTTFTGDVVSPLVDQIDIISAGFPCQPWSVAGSQKGTDDERWFWPLIFRLVREIRPRSIFLENVPGLLHGGIEYVLGDLASVGFCAEWESIRASDVGAPHRRERVFILANSKSERPREAGQHIERPTTRTASNRTALGNSRRTRSQIGEVHAGQVTGQGSAPVANTGSVLGQDPQPGRTQGRESSDASGASGELGNANGSGLSAGRHREREHEVRDNRDRSPTEDIEQRGVGQSETSEGSEALGYTDSKRRRTQGDSEQQSTRAGWGGRPLQWPPSPQSTESWGEVIEVRPDLAPATQPEVRGVVDGLAGGLGRADQLRILGNGVVPQQAALAYTLLSERISNP